MIFIPKYVLGMFVLINTFFSYSKSDFVNNVNYIQEVVERKKAIVDQFIEQHDFIVEYYLYSPTNRIIVLKIPYITTEKELIFCFLLNERKQVAVSIFQKIFDYIYNPEGEGMIATMKRLIFSYGAYVGFLFPVLPPLSRTQDFHTDIIQPSVILKIKFWHYYYLSLQYSIFPGVYGYYMTGDVDDIGETHNRQALSFKVSVDMCSLEEIKKEPIILSFLLLGSYLVLERAKLKLFDGY